MAKLPNLTGRGFAEKYMSIGDLMLELGSRVHAQRLALNAITNLTELLNKKREELGEKAEVFSTMISTVQNIAGMPLEAENYSRVAAVANELAQMIYNNAVMNKSMEFIKNFQNEFNQRYQELLKFLEEGKSEKDPIFQAFVNIAQGTLNLYITSLNAMLKNYEQMGNLINVDTSITKDLGNIIKDTARDIATVIDRLGLIKIQIKEREIEAKKELAKQKEEARKQAKEDINKKIEEVNKIRGEIESELEKISGYIPELRTALSRLPRVSELPDRFLPSLIEWVKTILNLDIGFVGQKGEITHLQMGVNKFEVPLDRQKEISDSVSKIIKNIEILREKYSFLYQIYKQISPENTAKQSSKPISTKQSAENITEKVNKEIQRLQKIKQQVK